MELTPAHEDRLFDPDNDEIEDSTPLTEYDLVSTPNDFNVMTIKSFLESGAVKIPRYQRNFVWDRARSSKLIESLILGLPVPQVFLYEDARNSFQIIDGQQRLMSIYFFLVGRFPRKKVRPLLRSFWGEKGAIPAEVLFDDAYFEPFKLSLKTTDGRPENSLNGENFETLGERQVQLSMRPLRNVIIKQVSPAGRGAVYEIFNRLNTTGVNLTPQEIRVSLASSAFMEMLFEINDMPEWRTLLGMESPDPRLKDLEILLRAFAMADGTVDYKPSMVRFLNEYADETRSFSLNTTQERVELFKEFLRCSALWKRDHFLASGRFSVPVFEAVYAGFAKAKMETGTTPILRDEALSDLVTDSEFIAASSNKTTDTRNVDRRINLAADAFRSA
ncbi:DUF262 domain-containing protein [Salinibacterium sp. NSLL150]|uniref:DUF262 domain-containing protein n=1 Tax=unclassified Salinibacterium TaxID=2632331 RepID=UPI0018CD9B5E|nr:MULTISPECIES: DUF262 domain-containing protein [unclassified Salinibacterium]MBH0098053.1 DUF262 domain-containing protein [Salinibacterium sp. NSLL35]MBH0100808.1 DUF262 domain-containing protein [Salinibacterium sp. NSLL150]MBH0103567.1 DUF262 domain-containing protein [Salinibacterium sp. NSLL16]MBH0106328.1 DUF262 domain-containing protein [Salinibacterium sp. NSLL17]